MRQDGGGPGSGQGGRGLSEKRMFKQDQKDGRRQAGRVLIFLLTPAKTVGAGEGGRRGRGGGRGGDKLDLMHLRVSASL